MNNQGRLIERIVADFTVDEVKSLSEALLAEASKREALEQAKEEESFTEWLAVFKDKAKGLDVDLPTLLAKIMLVLEDNMHASQVQDVSKEIVSLLGNQGKKEKKFVQVYE